MNPDADPLSQLRDIVEPDAVSWWPPAPGWWLLGLLIVALIAALIWWWRGRRPQPHWPDAARSSLAGLKENNTLEDREWLAQVSVLVRRIALAGAPRSSVAALTGEAWLARLDELSQSDRFSQGAGRCLADGPWQAQITLTQAQRRELLEAVGLLIARLQQTEADT
ncbi:DUF4381 domain-containing protein [Granulosicoccaceae sp. 1_MG-2023]|nr:DUF4381 domain-containing protein [Granulosicoccaceae sp. 1_MG-2023]